MKKAISKILIIGTGVLSSILPGTLHSKESHVIVERQMINKLNPDKKHNSIMSFGGLPLVSEYFHHHPSMTPKQYGMLYGNGKSRKDKINRKHRAHFYKIKSRR